MSKSRPPYVLGRFEFRTKKEVAAKAREILWESVINERFAPESDEHRFLCPFIEWHPEAAEKIGSGIEAFSVSVTGFVRGFSRGDRQFNVHRLDGTADNFSYKKCLQPASHRQKCLEAFRNSIRSQIDEIRTKRFLAEGLDPMDFDVHHQLPLVEMVASFLAVFDLHIYEIKLKGNEAGGYCEELADTSLAARWQEFHRNRARVQVIPKAEHQMIPTRPKAE